MISQVANWASILAGALAALFWYKSSIAKIPAPEGTEGVGALWGGYLIGLSKGERIDLLESLQLQSSWNAWAAIAACVASILQIASWIATNFDWP